MFEFLTPLTAFSALILSLYNWTQSRRWKRRKLVNTIYYHTKYAIEALRDQQKKNHLIQEKIKNNNSYTPYVPRSSADDLTYEHIIDVMEWLDEDGEKSVSSYFYTQMGLHALAQTFDTEFVRGWPQKRNCNCGDFTKNISETHSNMHNAHMISCTTIAPSNERTSERPPHPTNWSSFSNEDSIQWEEYLGHNIASCCSCL